MTCAYCGETLQPDALACSQCGAPVEKKGRTSKGEPFLYNGYVVWPAYDYHDYDSFVIDKLNYSFWLGDRLIETIKVDRHIIREMIPENTDPFNLIWDLFKLTQEPDEVLRIQEQNKPNPATFEIRHIPNQDTEYLKGLRYSDLLQELHGRRT